MSGRDHRVIDGRGGEAGRMAGQGAAATDRGVDMSDSRTPNLCERPRSAPRWTPPTSGGTSGEP
jgi:hypothetical protein